MATSCDSYSISNCSRYAAAVECISILYRGESKDIEILLSDSSGNLLDLDNVTEILLAVFDDRGEILELFKYPIETGYSEVQILQEPDSLQIINKGKISINVSESISGEAMVGNLYVEIRIKIFISTDNEEIILIPRLLIAKIKASVIYDYFN